MSEFDYQWEYLPDVNLELTPRRIDEFLDYVQLPASWFHGKACWDAGCGQGRWTWAMMQLGATVLSMDISDQAISLCRKINPLTFKHDIQDPLGLFVPVDFVFCWGVLHHLRNPLVGFKNLSAVVRPGGYLHVMVYHKKTQRKYWPFRKLWRALPNNTLRYMLCKALAGGTRKTIHGWWDALNPQYNHGFYPDDIREWFESEGFTDIVLTKEFSINMIGRKT